MSIHQQNHVYISTNYAVANQTGPAVYKLLKSGVFKRVLLNSSDLNDPTTISIIHELMDNRQSFRVLYDEKKNNWYIRLTLPESEEERDWKR
jgi:hypothetical protein